MNTVTRTIPNAQGNIKVTSQLITIIGLLLALLMTAFAVVYLKDLNRRLFIQFQTLRQSQQVLTEQKEKLLLAQSVWSTQKRVQQIAKRDLNMVAPNSNDIILVELNPSQSKLL